MKKEKFNWMVAGFVLCACIAFLMITLASAEPQFVGTSSGELAQRISYDGSDRIQYVGECYVRFQNQGSSLAWRIKRLAYDGASTRVVSTLWANRSIDFEFAWNLRATYTY
jgi:hypothetical protein